jgi:hypothetical protein
MSDYTERVEQGLKGLNAVSTGPCPGCAECAESHNYRVEECDSERCPAGCYVEVGGIPERHSNLNPQSHHATEALAEIARMERFDADWHACRIESEPCGRGQWRGCGICNSHLAGDFEVWHGIDPTSGEICHFDDACVDCVVYLANGDEPEDRD